MNETNNLDAVDKAIVDAHRQMLAEYVAAHEDDDHHDPEEMERMFRLAYGREPDDQDRDEGLWSHIVAATA